MVLAVTVSAAVFCLRAGAAARYLNSLETLDQKDLLKLVKSMMSGGVFLNFPGKRSAMEIAKRAYALV